MEEGIKGTSTFTIHTCPAQSQVLSPREKTLCELQCGERRNHRATQSRIRASAAHDTHVPLKSMTQEWKHGSVSRWLGVLEVPEGTHDESVWPSQGRPKWVRFWQTRSSLQHKQVIQLQPPPINSTGPKVEDNILYHLFVYNNRRPKQSCCPCLEGCGDKIAHKLEPLTGIHRDF